MVARALSTRFEPGERVAVWAPNIPEWIMLEYGCAMAGTILVTVNPSYQAEELAYVINQSGAAGIFLLPDLAAALLGPASLVALAHGVWLAVTYPIDPQLSINLLDHVIEETPKDSDGAAVAAAAAHYLAELRADWSQLEIRGTLVEPRLTGVAEVARFGVSSVVIHDAARPLVDLDRKPDPAG